MDPLCSAQDAVRCALCSISDAPMFCEGCHTQLCKDCVEEHFADSSKVHNVVPLKQYWTTLNYPKCEKHEAKQCELFCEHCDIPICARCISSKGHQNHNIVDFLENLERKRIDLQIDLRELEKSLFPKYKKIAFHIQVQKVDLKKNSQKIAASLNTQRDIWHREIDDIVNKLKCEFKDIESKHLDVLNKQEVEIQRSISELTQNIVDIKKLLNSKDVLLVCEYKSRNAKFRGLPPKFKISLPSFKPNEINRDQLMEQFGSLSTLTLTFTTEEQDNSMLTQGTESSPPDQPLMNEPRVITALDTRYDEPYSVSCLNDSEVWTRGDDNIMKLFNLKGELVKSIQTDSKNWPYDIAVTMSGDLVYTDYDNGTVNIVKNTQIQTAIRLKGWRPRSICSSSSGGYLVVVESDDKKQTKVVRYSGSKETQSIQFNSKGQSLYSSSRHLKYINENRNLDICVTDVGKNAVVVVNQEGLLRFIYPVTRFFHELSFDPRGVTTDSQSRILIADCHNDRIHILDQNGQFLRFIDNCDLCYPWGLCVDTSDNLFVADSDTGKVKKIQYCN